MPTVKHISFQGLDVQLIYKPSLKHSYIQINSKGEIVLKTPQRSLEYISNLLEKKYTWMNKHLHSLASNTQPQATLGKEILLFGELHTLKEQQFEQLREKIAKKHSQEQYLACYNQFYKQLAQKYIPMRVDYFAKKMQLCYTTIKFRKMKRRWGSCNSNKELTFNTQLMKVSKGCIDYVVVHELAHLVHMNHSQAFHALVESYLSDTTVLKKQLRNTQLG